MNLSTHRVSTLRLYALTTLLSVCTTSDGETITVPGDYRTIQDGIDAAQDGDEVVVSPGTYFENIDFTGKNLVVRSVDPSDSNIVDEMILDGQSLDSVVLMDRGTLSGFTILNGFAEDGGGVRLSYALGQDAEIRHNVISDCGAFTGGGIRASWGGPSAYRIVRENLVSGNAAWVGAGMAVGGVIVENNVITDNETCCFGGVPNGGGITAGGSAVIRNNVIVGNYSDEWGGGVRTTNGPVVVEDNLIAENQAGTFGGGVYQGSDEGMLRNNIIVNNATTYIGYGGGVLSAGAVVGNTIIGNSSGGYAGGVMGGVGLVVGNVIAGNSATLPAGGLWGSGMVMGNTIVGNSAGESPGGMYSFGEGATILGNVIAFSTAAGGLYISVPEESFYDYNCVFGNVGGDYAEGVVPGPNDIQLDPLFVDAGGPDGIIGTEDDNLRLSADSPCIDAGDPLFVPEPGETDLDGHARMLCGRVDIGAYEFGIGDGDCDGDVDLDDWGAYQACVTGPGGGGFGDGCASFDFDGDLDVDLADAGGMQSAFIATR